MNKYRLVFSYTLILFFAVFLQDAGAGRHLHYSDIILEQYNRYPAMEVQDLYKLCFQSAMGNYHAAMDSNMAREWLDKEWSETTPSDSVPEYEPINPDSTLIRVNLSGYKQRGGDKEKLLQAFIVTATQFKGSRALFDAYWSDVIELAENHRIPFTKDELSKYLEKRLSEGLPAVHHSGVYQDMYKPAYRVVLRKELY